MRRWLAVLLAAVLLAGCTGPDPGATAILNAHLQPGTTRKSIGVISAIGDRYYLRKVGITVFGNEEKTLPIEAWGIDDLVAGTASTHLGKRFDVRRITYAKGTFEPFDDPAGPFRDRDAELRDLVRKLGASQKCDLYLVVTKSGAAYGSSNQVLTGLGLVVGGSLLIDASHAHALTLVSVYDGQTFALLRRQRASMGQPTLMQTINGPNQPVDKTWWPASPQDAQVTRLRDTTRMLVEQSLRMTLAEVLPTQ